MGTRDAIRYVAYAGLVAGLPAVQLLVPASARDALPELDYYLMLLAAVAPVRDQLVNIFVYLTAAFQTIAA